MGIVRDHRTHDAMKRARAMVASGWRPENDQPPVAASIKRPELIYFIQAGALGPIKIGITTDLTARLAALQTASPSRLYVRHTMPGSLPHEREIHARFAHCRGRGEWFKPAGVLLDYIDRLRRTVNVE